MMLTIASVMMFLEIRDKALLRTLSDRILYFWLKWELRAMVILSLTVQLILIKLGSRRRFSDRNSKTVSFFTWTLYLFADWLAALALGTLLRSRKDKVTNPLVLFWAPFLLLHLGGPDTITAYSLSDNELWPRHFFGMCFHIGVALYVYVKFWTIATAPIIFMAIPIFIVGVIKYGERVWSLFKASSVRFRKSVFSGDKGSSLEVEHSQSPSERGMPLEEYLEPKQIKGKYGDLYRAFHLFHVFKPMFADLKLRIYKNLSYVFELDQTKVSAKAAFTIVEIELGFLYDLLYTKIPIVITRPGVILRFICLSLITCTLLAFFVFAKHHDSRVDIAVSYLLMVGAIFLEIYSALLHLSSDWGFYWLAQQNNGFLRRIGSKIVRFTKPKEGIRSMAQHSLLDYCLPPRKLNLAAVLNFFDSEDRLGKYLHTGWKDVSPELQQFIYSSLQEKRKKYAKTEFKNLSELLDERGSSVLKGMGGSSEDILWSVCEVEFTHSLLLWHVATEVVYHDDDHRYRAVQLERYCRISKALSDYMMYLLFLCPAMLPEGIGNIRHRDTCTEAMNFALDKFQFKEAVRGLFGMDIKSRSFFIQMGSSRKSAFFEGCQIAEQLQSLVSIFQWDNQDKWKLIADLWLDMLTYAAAQCSWKEHAMQLQHGEEFLTHVALLMAHLGLSKKIQMVPLPKMLEEADFEPTFHWDKLHRLTSYLA
ncbi:hypothetical protein ES332_A02G035800v1 [Gossypium tomentosum]|uniref:DUF4220 domain-containing protein n=1 Tax=Gossypium tomentosum TaxID=34277 RepID=A0A5D2RFH5_GOSTO|nr:hypothetical protein ES332_A02G035800v1 [Gossypium tomentosum]